MQAFVSGERSFERKPLLEFALGPATEFRHRTRYPVKEPFRPAICVDARSGRYGRHGHNNGDVCIEHLDVDAQVQPAVLCRVRSSLDGLAWHADNVLDSAGPIHQTLRSVDL